MHIIVFPLFHLYSIIYSLCYFLLLFRVCNKLTSPNTTGMIRARSNIYWSRYEFCDEYRIGHTCTWNPLLFIIRRAQGYNIENTRWITRDMIEWKKIPTMAIRSIHDKNDFCYRMQEHLQIRFLIMLWIVVNCIKTLVMY